MQQKSSITLYNLIKHAKSKLKQAGIINYQFEIFTLLEHYCAKSKLDYIINPHSPIDDICYKKFIDALEQRAKGVPFYRIIGKCNFYGLDINLADNVLQPRADTEIIVELACQYLKQKLQDDITVNFLEIGIGSGAISLAILNNFRNSNLQGVGVDISPHCIKLTQENARLHNLEDKIKIIASNCFENIQGQFDLIISNPPYIKTDDIAQLDQIVKNYDPHLALDGGEDGLKFYRILAQSGHKYLKQQGCIIIEIGAGQRHQICNIFQQHNFVLHKSQKDYSQIDRALLFASAVQHNIAHFG